MWGDSLKYVVVSNMQQCEMFSGIKLRNILLWLENITFFPKSSWFMVLIHKQYCHQQLRKENILSYSYILGLHRLNLSKLTDRYIEGMNLKIGGLSQERHNSIANALKLHLSCTSPSRYGTNSIIHPFKKKSVIHPCPCGMLSTLSVVRPVPITQVMCTPVVKVDLTSCWKDSRLPDISMA